MDRTSFPVARRRLLAWAVALGAAHSAQAEDVAAEPADDGASAVGRPRRRQRVHQGAGTDASLARLSSDLKLDAGQRDRIKPILEQQDRDLGAVRRQAGLTPAERSRRLQEVADRSVERIRAQLSDEQRRQYVQPVPARAAKPAPAAKPAARPPAAKNPVVAK